MTSIEKIEISGGGTLELELPVNAKPIHVEADSFGATIFYEGSWGRDPRVQTRVFHCVGTGCVLPDIGYDRELIHIGSGRHYDNGMLGPVPAGEWHVYEEREKRDW